MTRKKGKSPSFDAMIKFFIKRYDIPTRKDFDQLMIRIDQIEKLIREDALSGRKNQHVTNNEPQESKVNIPAAFQVVYDAINQSDKPVTVNEIMNLTGYGEKKIRNVLYRLGKMDKIIRADRGLYAIQRNTTE
ncbi:MAG: hypothetical protein AB7S77_03670 [Desulfatirhabdiaceae bacterium]